MAISGEKLADGESVNNQHRYSKISGLLTRRAAPCEPDSEPEPAILLRRNRAGELPIRIVTCDRTGRSRPVYPGQSESAVAARLGAVDWTSEPVGVRA